MRSITIFWLVVIPLSDVDVVTVSPASLRYTFFFFLCIPPTARSTKRRGKQNIGWMEKWSWRQTEWISCCWFTFYFLPHKKKHIWECSNRQQIMRHIGNSCPAILQCHFYIFAEDLCPPSVSLSLFLLYVSLVREVDRVQSSFQSGRRKRSVWFYGPSSDSGSSNQKG